jgi:hypothetical protein
MRLTHRVTPPYKLCRHIICIGACHSICINKHYIQHEFHRWKLLWCSAGLIHLGCCLFFGKVTFCFTELSPARSPWLSALQVARPCWANHCERSCVDACCWLCRLSPSQVNQALHNNSQTEHISFTQVRRFQSEHPIHICASEREGFGHYLNEARAAGALIITTDHPPMNELVTSGADHHKAALLRGQIRLSLCWRGCLREGGRLRPIRGGSRCMQHPVRCMQLEAACGPLEAAGSRFVKQ